VASEQGDYAYARSLFKESLLIQRELGDKGRIALSLLNLGQVVYAQGDYADARALFEESLAIRRELGDKKGIAYSLEAFASLAAKEQTAERSARLWGAAAALREALGSPLSPHEHERYDREVGAARETLGANAFAAAWEEGRAMSWEQAVFYAMEEQ
jgi:tetratricopeptide (TPR) repeat protein